MSSTITSPKPRNPSPQKKDAQPKKPYTTYSKVPTPLVPPVAYSTLPSTLPFADRQIPGVTPHSLTIYNRNHKYLSKHKDEEEERAKKYRDKSNKEKARSEKHITKAARKAEQGKDKRAAHHQKKAAKLEALSKVHHKVAQDSKAEYFRAQSLYDLPPRPTLSPSSSGNATS